MKTFKEFREEVEEIDENTGVTDYNSKRSAGTLTRNQHLENLKKSKSSDDATAARKAGATQKEMSDAIKSK